MAGTMPDTEGASVQARAIWRGGAIAIALAGIVGVFLLAPLVVRPTAPASAAVEAAPPSAVSASPYARLGRGVDDVRLAASDGRIVQWGDLAGPPRAVFFGFTHCPEVCPTTVAELSASMERLGPRAAALRVDFVTFDPERDTPAVLADYLGGFGPAFRGYAGDRAEIDRLAKSYRAAQSRTPLAGDDYTIDHTTTVYLLDGAGNVVDILAYQSAPDVVDAKLTGLLVR
jgi:protein SCO1